MMRRTMKVAAMGARTSSSSVLTVTSRRLLASSSQVVLAERKPRVGDIDVSKVDPMAGFDLNGPEEDLHPDVNFGEFLKKRWRERKGMPHPYDELDPDDEPGKIKKAQFPY